MFVAPTVKSFIFLDIDGVLNSATSKSQCGSYVGIDDDKVEILKKLAYAIRAEIVLISSWKEQWYKQPFLKAEQDELANYLERKLNRHRLYIRDKIGNGSRAEEIIKYAERCNMKNFLILDDEVDGYEEYGLLPHLIRTDANRGLLKSDFVNNDIYKQLINNQL